MSADKVGIRKRSRWRLEALTYDSVCLLMTPFSFAQISGFGGWLLRKIGPLTSKHYIMMRGLEIAFPDMDADARNVIARQSWDNIGRTFAEFPVMNRVDVFSEDSRVTLIGREHLEALITAQKGAVIVTGHFANWEIMAAALTQSGLPVRITYRKINNPHIDARVRKQRGAYGAQYLVQKSTHAGGRVLLEALHNGQSVAILNDQKFNEGISLPFFGQPAMTATGATRLALKTGAPILPISVTRDKDNFTVTIEPPWHLNKTGQRDADVSAGVAQIMRWTEDKIRSHKSQWFWVHRRWPKSLYKKDKS